MYTVCGAAAKVTLVDVITLVTGSTIGCLKVKAELWLIVILGRSSKSLVGNRLCVKRFWASCSGTSGIAKVGQLFMK